MSRNSSLDGGTRGPRGDNDPERPLANIVADVNVREGRLARMRTRALVAEDLRTLKPTVSRQLYFIEYTLEREEGEARSGANDDANTRFYLTFAGLPATTFEMYAEPAISAHQGTVEDWTITNPMTEDHVFHIHQLHFQVLEINGKPVNEPILRDTINVPHMTWQPRSDPSTVKLRMDFRRPNLIGTFIYQCHLAAYEQGGMVGAIQVLPPAPETSVTIASPATVAPIRQSLVLVATVASRYGKERPTGTVQFLVDGKTNGSPVPL